MPEERRGKQYQGYLQMRRTPLGMLVAGRWLLLLIFVGGYLGTSQRFEAWREVYFGLTVLSLVSCWLLLTRLRGSPEVTLPIWVILLVFMFAYYAKFYWFLIDDEITVNMWRNQSAWIRESMEVFLGGYAVTTYAFVAFCAVGWMLLVLSGCRSASVPTPAPRYGQVLSALVWLLPILMALTSYVMYTTRVGILGTAGVSLPLRVAGVIFYSRAVVLPALLVLLIWCAEEAGRKNYFYLGICLLLIHGLSEAILKTSKGAFLWAIILLACLFVLTGRVTSRGVMLAVGVGMVNVAAFPLFVTYRAARITDPSLTITGPLQAAVSRELDRTAAAGEILLLGVRMAALRFNGVDNLLPIIGSAQTPLGIDNLFDSVVERILTIDVLGYSPYQLHATAPGLLGWLYLVGGTYLAVAGVSILVIALWVVWRVMQRAGLMCLPVAQSLLLVMILNFSIEGTFDYLPRQSLAVLVSIGACECILRATRKLHPPASGIL